MEPFKNVFNKQLIVRMATHFSKHHSDFEHEGFVSNAAKNFESLELKARSNQIVDAMVEYLPKDFDSACKIIEASLAAPSKEEKHPNEDPEKGLRGWAVMPMADYVALQGKSYLEQSLLLLKELTMRFSSEFAIRPFLHSVPEEVLPHLHEWCEHENVHVRRLVSEGTRPRLPWGMQLSKFVADPKPILPLLDKLKDDSDEYVRRSVANNLNDIAKDHPDLVAKIASDWLQDASKNRQRLVKHACRTLFKQGHVGVLKSFGFLPPELANIALVLDKKRVQFGQSVTLSLDLKNHTKRPQRLMIDYAIHHLKANGEHSAKVFKWKNMELAEGQSVNFEKQHALKPITTRVYYPGTHFVEIIINGQGIQKQEFELLM